MNIKKWIRKKYIFWKYKHNWNTGKVIILKEGDRQLGLTTMMLEDYLNNDHVVGVGYNGYSYTAQISKDNKTIWLGSFTSEDDAIKARLLAEKKYYNEFSPQKHLFEKYGIGDL